MRMLELAWVIVAAARSEEPAAPAAETSVAPPAPLSGYFGRRPAEVTTESLKACDVVGPTLKAHIDRCNLFRASSPRSKPTPARPSSTLTTTAISPQLE